MLSARTAAFEVHLIKVVLGFGLILTNLNHFADLFEFSFVNFRAMVANVIVDRISELLVLNYFTKSFSQK